MSKLLKTQQNHKELQRKNKQPSHIQKSQRTTQSVVGFTTEFVRGINQWNLTAQPESYKTVRTNQYYSIVKIGFTLPCRSH